MNEIVKNEARKKLSVTNGAPILPFCRPKLGENEIAELVETLESGWLTTGPKVKRFEKAIADYTGARHVVAVNSCTAALHLALLTLGIGRGDEVITTPLTFCSTVNTIVHTGAKPVFVDVCPDTLNIQPDAVLKAITSRTRAIVVVDYAGHPVDHTSIRAIAEAHDLPVIEDAAHAIGAQFEQVPVGALSTITTFSFYAIKNMTTGEGGAFVTNDDELAEKARIYSLHGMSKDAWKRYSSRGSWYYEVVYPGFKYNMMDMQAALGLHQLKKLDGFIETRSRYSRIYDEYFADSPLIQRPISTPNVKHAWHLYVIRLSVEQMDIDRAEFITKMMESGIGCTVNFIPVHLHPYYQTTYGYRTGMYPVAEDAYMRMVSLPLHPAMSEHDVARVATTVMEIVAKHSRVKESVSRDVARTDPPPPETAMIAAK